MSQSKVVNKRIEQAAREPVAGPPGEPAERRHPVPGRGKGMLTIVSEDDEHLKDWAEYMPAMGE
jgi:hypothetical protein